MNSTLISFPAGAKTASSGAGYSKRACFWTVVLIALAVRLSFVFAVTGYSSMAGLDHYEAIAKAFLEGKGFMYLEGKLSAYRAPLYPLFIAGLYRIFGYAPAAVWIAQCVLGALTAGFVFLLSGKFAPRKFALGAGVAAALYPPLIRACGFLLTETLFTFLFVAALCLIADCWRQMDTRRAAAAGIFLGLASLTRPVLFLFPFGLFALAMTMRLFRLSATRWRGMAALLLSFLLVLAPWGIRNWLLLGKPIVTTTEGGASLWIGVHPDPQGFGYNNYENLVNLLDRAGKTGEIEMDEHLAAEAWRDIASDPLRFAKLAVAKVAWLYYVYDGDDYGLGTCFNLPGALVLTFGMLGLLLWARRREGQLPAFALLYFTIIAAMLYGIPRFRLPLDPLLIALAAGGLYRISAMAGRPKRAWTIAVCAVVLMLAFLAVGDRAAKEGLKGMADRAFGYSQLVRGGV